MKPVAASVLTVAVLAALFVGSTAQSTVVLAGSSRLTWLPDAILQLRARVVNQNGGLSWVRWDVQHGDESSVSFLTRGSLATRASFREAGVYILRCTVSDAGSTTHGDLVVEVYDESQNFGGYRRDFLKSKFEDDIGLEYDFSGFRFDRFRAPPPSGQHPRLFISPGADEARLRSSMFNTDMGRKILSKFEATLSVLKTESTWRAAAREAAKDGGYNLDNVEADDMTFVSLVAYEVFRAYLYQDREAGRIAAGIIALICEKNTPKIEDVKIQRLRQVFFRLFNRYPQRRQLIRVDYREHLQGLTHRRTLAMAYDFGHGFMSEAHRERCRALFLTATTDVWSIGLSSLPTLEGMRSNWITTTGQLLFMSMVVEGESSTTLKQTWDAETFAKAVACYERYISVAFSQDGASAEGLGKNQMLTSTMVPLARRKYYLIASKNVRNHIGQYYAYNMLPWGRHYGDRRYPYNVFTWDEVHGGSNKESRYDDVANVHFAFPDDPRIAVVARAEMQDDYSRLNDFNVRVFFKALEFMQRAMVIQDIDRSKPWTQHYAQAMVPLPLHYFSDFRGRAVMMSSWNVNALQLIYQPRHLVGGHSHQDRNKFCWYGLGVSWIECSGGWHRTADHHALVTINDDFSRPTYLPGKTIAKLHSSLATFYAGDARASYGVSAGLSTTRKFGKDVLAEYRPFTLNDHRFEPNLNMGDVIRRYLPNWKDGIRTDRNGTSAKYYPTPDFVGRLPVRAFRTTGIVRGRFPYALIVDDIQENESEAATYSWQAPLLSYAMRTVEQRASHVSFDGRNTVTITDWRDRRRKCMIRFVDSSSSPSLSWHPARPSVMRMKVTALRPDFKVILYAYREGDPLPTTEMAGGNLYVRFPGQQDHFDFAVDSDGRSRFKLSRDGHPVFDFTAASTVSPSGNMLRIPSKVHVDDKVDATANSFTLNWEAGECDSNPLKRECLFSTLNLRLKGFDQQRTGPE